MRTAIEAIVARVPQWDGRSPVIRPLRGHARARLFAVAVDGREYVVRQVADVPLLGISAANAVEATRRAASLAVGPPMVDDAPAGGGSITALVPARALEADRVEGRLESVVRVLRRFHRSPPLTAGFPVHRVVEWHTRDAGANGAAVPATYERLHQLSRRIEAAFARAPMDPVPCHNNLAATNLLFDAARAWLVDFECGGNNDVFFDLANLSMHCEFSDAVEERLLELYFGRASVVAVARLRLMKLMSEFREGMWGVALRAVGLLDPDALDPTDQLRRCERHAARPEVDRWLIDAAAGM
jgi:hypothetical protein